MPLVYPATCSDDSKDALAGAIFPDPYRWLEDQENETVLRWQREQAQIASSYVGEWPQLERLRRLVTHFNTGQIAPPRYAGGKWFRTSYSKGASQAQAKMSTEPLGEGRVLFDPLDENPDRAPFLSWLSPSPNGRILALGLCADGSENNTIRLIDVDSGLRLPSPPAQTLMDNWTGGAHWLPDSTGFFFTAIVGTAFDHEQRVYLHLRVPVPHTVALDIPWSHDYRMVMVSRDGHHAVAMQGVIDAIPVAVARLSEGPLRWRPFVTSAAGKVAGHIIGGSYIAITDVAAPRGRLVAIPLDADDPNDSASWQELVGESEAVLRTVTPVSDRLYLSELIDTYSRVRVLDVGGRPIGQVPLPGRGALRELPLPLMNLVPKGHPDRFLFGFSSLTVSPGLYSHTPGQETIEVLQAPRVHLENCIVEDCTAISSDETPVPYHIVRRTDVSTDRAQPTLVFAYGGFNLPLVPKFPGPMAAFAAAGGLLVHAHLRGGGEFGRDWWLQGRWDNKHQTYDDLYAIAADLIARGRTEPHLLAITGDSNGGQTAAIAAIARPDLWAAAVPRAPRLDLIGSCRFRYGRQSNLEDRVSSIADPDDARRLAELSPYHLVRDGVRYPAVYVDAGNTDPRCPPWEARKFVARLQAANAGPTPVLLHVWENAGHGLATDRNTTVAAYTEWLAFVLRQLNVNDWDE